MAVEMVPLKGGRDYIIPQLAGFLPLIYIYILPSGGLYNPYPLLGELETTIDHFGKGRIDSKSFCSSTKCCERPNDFQVPSKVS